MRVLGIHDGHTSTAALVEDGEVKFALSEERLTRKKNQGGFPEQSIRLALKKFDLKPADIDEVVLVGWIKPLKSIESYKSGRQKFFPRIVKLYPGNPRNLIRKFVDWSKGKRLQDPKLQSQLENVGFSTDRIKIQEHQQTHASVAYYMSPFHEKGEETLVITLDGSGDGLSGSISKVAANGNWERLQEISTFDSLGMIYSRVTQYLAMKPWEHEFKLMGMAPYCGPKYAKAVRDVLARHMRLSSDGLNLENPTRIWGNELVETLHSELRGFRFDSVSAGVQLLHEEIVVDLVRNWVRKTGIGRIAAAGGCFMNVKANMLIMNIDEVEDFFVMPSGGDESCAIGAALQVYADSKPAQPIKPLHNLYWGTEFTNEEVEEYLRQFSDKIEYELHDNIERKGAELLAEHKILARLDGRCEWGARALGNRSIIANASRLDNLRKLNAAIKMRDFWMPFAPSIKWERRKDYAVFHKDIDVHHMTIAFESTDLAKEHIPAALHPYDRTMRPQFVKEEHNPRYHKLISEYEKITGMGGILNTSFNLHGWPIVHTPTNAVETLLKSDLDYVMINDFLVWKKN